MHTHAHHHHFTPTQTGAVLHRINGLTGVQCHAVLQRLPSLYDTAGVCSGLITGRVAEDEDAHAGGFEGHSGPQPEIHSGLSIGACAAHQFAVLLELAVGARQDVGGAELTVNPQAPLYRDAGV